MGGELTAQEYDTLIEALVAWEEKDRAGEMVDELIEAAVLRNGMPPPGWAEKKQGRREEAARQRSWRKEQSVLLRAKLITLRNAATAGALIEEALRP